MTKLANETIEQSRHDIESIESYINKHGKNLISIEQVGYLRGFQHMYRQRIVRQQMGISESQADACTQ